MSEALKRGAIDYIEKPMDIEAEFLPLLARILGSDSEEEEQEGKRADAGEGERGRIQGHASG